MKTWGGTHDGGVMNRQEVFEAIEREKIVVALRGLTPEELIPTALALYEGGIRMLEVTFDQADPDRLARTAAEIRLLKKQLGTQMMIGAGTVINEQHAAAAIEAGAEFLLSPNVNLQMIAKANQMGIGVVPGAITPTEILSAWEAGAAVIKLFPIGNFGPSYVKAISAPLSGIPFLGMGGINEKNMLEYLEFPQIIGIGVGAGLAKTSLIHASRWNELTELARKYTEQLK